jgi:AcrR family transcriptional regulator
MATAPADQGTRERLVEAAKELFSRDGYAGTGTRAIAARAGCNLSLIKHYFGSKAGLLLAVVEENLAGVRQALRGIVAGAGTPEEKLGRFIDLMVDNFDQNRKGMRVFHREIVMSDTEILPDVRPIAGANVEMMGELIRSAVAARRAAQRAAEGEADAHAGADAEGEVDADAHADAEGEADAELDPRFAAMLLMGMMQFYFIAYPVTSRVLAERSPELIAELKRHIKRIFLRGVRG